MVVSVRTRAQGPATVEVMLAEWSNDPSVPDYAIRQAREVVSEALRAVSETAWDQALRVPLRLAKRSYPKGLVSTAIVVGDLEAERRANPYVRGDGTGMS